MRAAILGPPFCPQFLPIYANEPNWVHSEFMKCTFWIYIYKLLYFYIIYEFDLPTNFYGGTTQNFFLNAKQNAWDRKQES